MRGEPTKRWLTAVALGSALLGSASAGAPPAEGAFPGTNGRLVQSGTGSGVATRGPLVAINPDGTGAVNLSPPVALDIPFCCYGATWSPDGREIAFGGEEEQSLYVVDAASGAIEAVDGHGANDQTTLVNINQIGASPLAWSPAGDAIAFSQEMPGSFTAAIWTIRRDASGWQLSSLRQQTAGGEERGDYEPSWAMTPDGERIVFSSWRDNDSQAGDSARELYIVDPNAVRVGFPDSRLTIDLATDDHRPDVSPDGTLIAWQRTGPPTGPSEEVWVMSHTGAGKRKVADGSLLFWSPEGRIVAQDGSGYFTVDADGLNRAALPGFPDDASDWGVSGGYTPAGQNVLVDLGDVQVTFADVTAAGNTAVTTSGSGPASPGGFRLLGSYHDITTTAAFAGLVTVCVASTDTAARLFHHEGGAWVDVTTVPAPPQTCGQAETLSPFALFAPAGTMPGGTTPTPAGTTLADTTPPSFFGSTKADPATFAVDPKGIPEQAVKSARRKNKVKKGTSFRYTLSEAARVDFTIERKVKGRKVGRKCKKQTGSNRNKKPCTRFARFGAFAQQANAGNNTKKFSGRIGKKKLSPGKYRATLVATDAAGNQSKARQVALKVVRP